MTLDLTEQQRQALDAYMALMAAQPALFSGRRARPIVRDRDALAVFAREHGIVLGLVADTPFVWFIVDLVESPRPGGGVLRHPYLRVVSRAPLDGGTNVVVLATIDDASLGSVGDIVLVEQERHALGTVELELPRGFGTSGISGEVNALRELEEETGYIGEHARHLGTTCTDSGLTDGTASFYHVPVLRRAKQSAETEEAIVGVHLASRAEVLSRIRSGAIRDAFTVQAMTLSENA